MPKDKLGWTPLHYGCNYGHVNIVTYLINEQTSDCQVQSAKGETPLHVTCSPSCSEEKAFSVLKYLTVTCSCDINARDSEGNTPLMYLLYHRPSMMQIARYLIIECQCDTLLKNHNGDTAFHIAGTNSNTDLVKLLIETRGSEINTKNKEKNTPLHLACSIGCEEVVKLLLSSEKCCLYELNKASHTPLQVAEANNHLNIISLIIYAMYDNPDDSLRNTPLHIACQAQNVHLAMIILDMNFNVTAANSNGDTPLHLACRNGSLKLVKLLLDNCDVDSRNKNGDTPLHEACKLGHLSIVKILLERSVFPDAKNYAGSTPTHYAIHYNNFEVAQILISWPGSGMPCTEKFAMKTILTKVKHLVNEGVDPLQLLQIKIGKEMKNFLHVACMLGDSEAVHLLASDGKNSSDINGWTPLHYGCYYGHQDIVCYLIKEVQSNTCLTTNDGISPLQLACDSQCLKLVTYLVNVARCNPNTLTFNRDTLLLYLLKCAKSSLSILQYLITDCCCDLSIQDVHGNTPLHIACSKVSNLDAVNMIISRNDWSPHIRNCDGNTPLHLACEHGHSEIVKTLLATKKCGLYELNEAQCTPLEVTSSIEVALYLIRGMFIYRDKNGNTPLHTACENQNLQQIQLVVENDFDVSTRNSNGDTPLHLLCRNGNNECAKIITNLNCDLDVQNKDGDTPLSLACRLRQYLIVETFLTTENAMSLCNKDNNGDTPLHLACRTGSVQLVRLILEKCSTVHIKEQNNSGDTPLHMAYKVDNPLIALHL